MQIFQLLSINGKIHAIRPYNPFAQGVIEMINSVPIEEQAQVMNQALKISGLAGKLEIFVSNGLEAINAELGIVVYKLTLL